MKRDELYVDVTSGYNVIKKAAGQDLSLSKQTLFKRLEHQLFVFGLIRLGSDIRRQHRVRETFFLEQFFEMRSVITAGNEDGGLLPFSLQYPF